MVRKQKKLYLYILLLFIIFNFVYFQKRLRKYQYIQSTCRDPQSISNPICLRHHIQSQTKHDVIIVQANKAFLPLVQNLICSIKNQYHDTKSILIWSMDSTTHEFAVKQNILSIYDPERYFGVEDAQEYHSIDYNKMMRQRADFWIMLVDLGISFWWIDADVAIDYPIYTIPIQSDFILQMDGPFWISEQDIMQKIIEFKHVPGTKWMEACAGFFHVKANHRTLSLFKQLKQQLVHNPSMEDQQALNLLLSNSSVATYGKTNISGNENRATFDFFQQETVWSGHHFMYGNDFIIWEQQGHPKPSHPWVFHINGIKFDHKKTKLNEYGMWFVNEQNNCKV